MGVLGGDLGHGHVVMFLTVRGDLPIGLPHEVGRTLVAVKDAVSPPIAVKGDGEHQLAYQVRAAHGD
jgi:hypothetical protein